MNICGHENILRFFNAELTGPKSEREAIRYELIQSARESDCPASNGSIALWAIGLRHWATNQNEKALRCFQKCGERDQFEFPHDAWSRAILQRATTAPENPILDSPD